MDLKFFEVNLYAKNFLLISSDVHVDQSFVLGIYKSGLSSIYLREYLTTPPIIEKRKIVKNK